MAVAARLDGLDQALQALRTGLVRGASKGEGKGNAFLANWSGRTLADISATNVGSIETLPTAPMGDSATLQPGQTAIVIGSPLGTFTNSVTTRTYSSGWLRWGTWPAPPYVHSVAWGITAAIRSTTRGKNGAL